MSSQRSEKITCPGCGKEHDFEMWNSLNTMLDPDMKEKLLSKEMFQFVCPDCGYTANVDYGFLYHQMEDRIMIYYIQDEDEIEKTIKMITGEAYDSFELSEALQKAKREYLYRIVLSQNDLLEKIHIFDNRRDDRMIEIMKVLMTGRIMSDHPEAEPFRLFYDSDDENEFFVLVGESDVIGTVELPEELYDAIKDEYEDKFVPLRGSDEYVIDFDWAVNLLGIDQAIYESEKEIEDGAEALDAHEVFSELDEKHFS